MKYWLRNTLYLTVLSVLSPWLLWRALRTGRYRRGWRDKLLGCKPLPVKPVGTRRVWLHGVSVGEIQLIEPLMIQLKTCLPEVQFIVSTTTDTGMELARKLYSHRNDTHLIYFPLDLSWAVHRTIQGLNADLLVLAELEVWPNLLELAANCGLPVAVVNGRLSLNSFQGYRRFSALTAPMFSKLHLVVAQSPEYAQRFVACGVPAQRVVVGGSFKFDNVSFDRQCPQVAQLRQLVGLTNRCIADQRLTAPLPSEQITAKRQPVWVVGSSQAPEELVACQAYFAAKRHYPGLKLIVVPRHRERFDEVWQLMLAHSPRSVRRSQLHLSVLADDWDMLLVDTIGELKWWWGLADLALVGGSFGARNGQNMLEAAGYGANVAFGPKTANFRSIVELLLGADAAVQIDSLEQIEGWLLNELAHPDDGSSRGQRAQQLIRQHQGTVARTSEQILSLLSGLNSTERRHAA